MNKPGSLPELLSPCGSREAAEAAVAAGADAVYLGGRLFNARMNAKNFDDGEMRNVINYCHSNGVRVYVTLNTLLYDRELPAALDYAGFLYNSGADAVISADTGLIRLLRERIPCLPIHASTQFTAHNLASLRLLAELGVSRAVVARELSANELDYLCRESPVELEMFVHGALCVSCSGQCLLSSMIGGRSGNRGECAQPCRMKYDTLDGGGKMLKSGGYPISLRDMCLAGHITDIISSGVASLKIEGRMKSPDYVYGVTNIYRRLLDERRNASKSDIDALAKLFSRGGFTDSYYGGGNIRLSDMLGIRSESDKADTRRTEASYPARGAYHTAAKPAIIYNRNEIKPDTTFKPRKIAASVKKSNIAVFGSAERVAAPDFFDAVFLPINEFDGKKANGILLPPVIFDGELDGVKKRLADAKANGAEYIMLSNPGQLPFADGFQAIAGFRLNITNSASAAFYAGFTSGVILSPELILPQLRDISCENKGAVVYGRIPVMTFASRLGNGVRALRDRTGALFTVINEAGRDVMYNSVPIYMADKANELDSAGIALRLFYFSDEDRRTAESAVGMYKKGLPPAAAVRRIQSKPQNGSRTK